jgi:predicted transcriptional regulator
MTQQRRPLRLVPGELEMLQMLWREGGVTILEAQQALGLPIGYTTVQTKLNRLVKKGVVEKSRQRPARYRASVTPEDVSQEDLDLLVERVSQGKVVPLVAHLVNRKDLDPSEISELKRLISEAERRVKTTRSKRAKP